MLTIWVPVFEKTVNTIDIMLCVRKQVTHNNIKKPPRWRRP